MHVCAHMCVCVSVVALRHNTASAQVAGHGAGLAGNLDLHLA